MRIVTSTNWSLHDIIMVDCKFRLFGGYNLHFLSDA
jgi:hypothetical protein